MDWEQSAPHTSVGYAHSCIRPMTIDWFTMKRTILIAAPALAAVLVLTGCSSDADTSTPASNSTTSASADAKNSGAVDAQNVLARMASSTSDKQSAVVTLSATGAQQMSGKGSMAFGDPAAAEFTISTTIEGETQEIQMRLVDNTLYFGMPMLQQATGKQWIKVSADGTDEMSQSLKPMFDQLTQSADFSSNLEFLKAGTTVTEVGPETVNGVETTKYKLTTDVAKAAAAAPESQKELIAQLQSEGIKQLTSYVWVDGDGLPVKYEQTVTIDGESMTTTMVYESWGEPVDVKAPAASEVADLSALLGSES